MNIATALKSEISRVARKEFRTETQQLKKAAAQYRTDIATLKRRLAELETKVGRLGEEPKKKPLIDTLASTPQRLTFKGSTLAAQRARLGLSVDALGAILGVSGQSVRKWEQGKATPRASQLPAIRAIAKMGKRAIAEKLRAAN